MTVAFLVCVALICVAQSLGNDSITCQASIDQIASVTCNFTSNLNATRDSFIVLYYKPNEVDPYIILSCHWKDQQKMPECYVENGVNFDRVVNLTLTATVTTTLAVGGGHFICQLVPSGKTRSEKCQLKHRDNVTQSTTQSTQTDKVTQSTTQSTQTDKPCSDIEGIRAQSIGVTFIVTVVIILVILVILWKRKYIYNRFLSCRRGNTGTENASGEAMMPNASGEAMVPHETQTHGILQQTTITNYNNTVDASIPPTDSL